MSEEEPKQECMQSINHSSLVKEQPQKIHENPLCCLVLKQGLNLNRTHCHAKTIEWLKGP